MDHFILPTGTKPYISVPYKCAFTYTPGGDFMSFPERHGWTNEHLHGDDDFGHKHPSEIESFFQTWLYFGMLLEVLHLAGVQANTDDFVVRDNKNETAVITTRSLPSLLRRWKGKRKVSSQCNCYLFATEGEGEYRPTEEYLQSAACKRKTCWLKLLTMADIEALHTIIRIMEKVHWFIERYCGIRKKTKMAPAKKRWLLDDTIALSIAALGFTFSEAIEDIYRLRGGSKLSWNVDILLIDRLRSANWCPSRIDLTVTDFSIDGLYYLAADPQQDTEDHTLCTELRCVSKGLNRDVYRTRHVTDDCQCEHHEPPLDEMLEIISSGGTPLVVWTQTKGKQLRVKKFITTAGHVPSVEIGENGKPVVPEQAPIYVAISHVWSDGLGNENQNSLPACQLSRIQSLVDDTFGFGGANGKPGHVPFWMDTLCVPVRKEHDSYRKKCIVAMRTIYQQAAAVLVLDAGVQRVPVSAPLVDQCMTLHESGWSRRLWTFQEGFLARKLLFRFQNASVDTTDMEQQLYEYTETLRGHGQYTPFVTIARGSVTAYYTLLKTAVNRLRLGELNPNDPNVAFLPLMGSLSHRRTTRASDEVLCAATILGMDPTPFLDPQCSSADDTPQEVGLADLRMQAFLRYIGRFPAGIIFNCLPRLQRNGYRWAPRSLMAGRIGDMTLGMDMNGLQRTGRMCRVDGSSVGLAVEYPGFILSSSSSSSAGIEKGRMLLSSSSSSPSFHYQVELFPEDDRHSSNSVTWNAKLQYFLVVAKIPTKETDGWATAILGSRADNDDGLKLRHEGCARIKIIFAESAQEGGDDATITCETLEADTMWFVQ